MAGIPRPASGKPLTSPLPYPGPVFSLSVSPDGRTFLLGGGGITQLHDMQTRQLLHKWPAEGNWPTAMFYPDGQKALRVISGFANVLDV